MKFVLYFVGIVLLQMISTACANREQFLECTKELGITEAMLKEGRESNKDRPEFRCLGACLMKKSGELEAGNNMNWDKVKENTSKYFGDKSDEIVKVRQECAEQSKGIADECDFAKAMSVCTMQKIPDLLKYIKL